LRSFLEIEIENGTLNVLQKLHSLQSLNLLHIYNFTLQIFVIFKLKLSSCNIPIKSQFYTSFLQIIFYRKQSIRKLYLKIQEKFYWFNLLKSGQGCLSSILFYPLFNAESQIFPLIVLHCFLWGFLHPLHWCWGFLPFLSLVFCHFSWVYFFPSFGAPIHIHSALFSFSLIFPIYLTFLALDLSSCCRNGE